MQIFNESNHSPFLTAFIKLSKDMFHCFVFIPTRICFFLFYNINKDAGKMVGSLCRSRKYTIPVMLYKYKYQIRMSEFELPDPLYPSPTEFKSVHAVF